MVRQRSRAWEVAERLRLVEEPGRRPVGSRAWWLRLALGAGTVLGAFLVVQIIELL